MSLTPEQIDALLPQTQCGLCGYGGCMPYAEAMVYEKAPINLCPPGGIKTLKELGKLLGEDPTPFIPEMEQNAKPKMLAVIREAECIGCTKCIQACPVDAILGGAKQMHTVISAFCTGCELCVSPCPVDCIDILTLSGSEENPEETEAKRNLARQHFHARQKRLVKEKENEFKKSVAPSDLVKKNYIQEAILRAKAKKTKI